MAREAGLSFVPVSQICILGYNSNSEAEEELARKLKCSTGFPRQAAWRNHDLPEKHCFSVFHICLQVFYQPVLAPPPEAINVCEVTKIKANGYYWDLAATI